MTGTTFHPATEDIAVIAKHVRGLVKLVPGATFSVRINRQWANVKNEPKSLLYVQGGIKIWNDPEASAKEKSSRMMLLGMLKDIAEEYQLELVENTMFDRYHLVQMH
jgi:hypothetical protein